jgi:hypothetical protein
LYPLPHGAVALSYPAPETAAGSPASPRLRCRWRRAHQVTGAYAHGIYTQAHDSSGYSGAVAGYRARRTRPAPLPEAPRPGRGAANVQTVAPYAVHEELGTRYRGAHPAAVPAFEEAKQAAPAIVRKHLKKLVDRAPLAPIPFR